MNNTHNLVLDSEIAKNYALFQYKSIQTGRIQYFEIFQDQKLDIDTMRNINDEAQLITFNGNNYDLPIMTLAMNGASTEELFEMSQDIIEREMRIWDLEKKWHFKMPWHLDHIDLIEVAPGQASLKLYGGRLHCHKLQDLPFDPDELISDEKRPIVRSYCANDLDTTIAIYKELLPEIQLRYQMSERYGQDLRSKSDAQIAEAVIKSEIKKRASIYIKRPDVAPGTGFMYKAPSFISFRSKLLKDALRLIESLEYRVSDSGKVEIPDAVADLDIKIGSGVYRMGNGGLHSSEKCVSHVAGDDYLLIDRDVTSYYPSIVLNCRLYPRHLGPVFLEVYKEIVDRRVEAKKAGNKVVADSLKITINGSFGKLGSKWSALYSPDLMIQVTMTGQLSLLMLIEALVLDGIEVVSANTDGIVIKCPKSRKSDLDRHIRMWELFTGFDTEETQYEALYSRDVNNYIAIKKDKKGVKTKGAYASSGLRKNPDLDIVNDAVCEFLLHGTPLRTTIYGCKDISKFVTVRSVKAGAVKAGRYEVVDDWVEVMDRKWVRQAWIDSGRDYMKGCVNRKSRPAPVTVGLDKEYLGRVVRFYYGKGATGYIENAKDGSKVPMSDGAIPLMTMTSGIMPPDVDHEYYVSQARAVLKEIGFLESSP